MMSVVSACAFKVTEGLLEEFGERRVRDTPISENTIVGTGVGAAMNGLRPIVELMTVNFSLLALDQIVNHAAAIPYYLTYGPEEAELQKIDEDLKSGKGSNGSGPNVKVFTFTNGTHVDSLDPARIPQSE